MARKRLADLLREEVNKPEEGQENSDQGESSAESTPSPEPVVEVAAVKVADTSDAQTDAQKEEVDRLKTTVEDLQQKEAQLQQQVSELQVQLEQKTALIETLQADLKKAESLKPELEEAKATLLQLAESNSQLTQELKSFRSAPQKPAPHPPASEGTLVQSEILRRQAASLAHPVFPATAPVPGQLSTQDMGWVD